MNHHPEIAVIELTVPYMFRQSIMLTEKWLAYMKVSKVDSIQ